MPHSPLPWPQQVSLDLPDADAVLSMNVHDVFSAIPFVVASRSSGANSAARAASATATVSTVAIAGKSPGMGSVGTGLEQPSDAASSGSGSAKELPVTEKAGAAATLADDEAKARPILAPTPSTGSLPRRRQLRSPVWTYFDPAMVRNGVLTATCRICGDNLVYRNSTTALDKHLLGKHRVNVRSNEGSAMSLPSSSSVSRTSSSSALSFSVLAKSTEDLSAKRVVLVDSSVQKFALLGEQTLSVLIDPAFQELLGSVDSSYSVMTLATLTARLSRDYDVEKVLLKTYLQSVEFVSLTLELWTSSAGDPFIEITVHFPNGPNVAARTLACSLIPYPHTHEATAEVIVEAMAAFEICDKVTAISADVASGGRPIVELVQQMVANARLGNSGATHRILSIGCLGHIINRTVQGALTGVKDVSELLTKLRAWTAFFGTHPKQLQALNEAQDRLKQPHCNPIRDNSLLRWTSVVALLESMETVLNGFDIYLSTLKSHAQNSECNDAQTTYRKVAPSCLTSGERELMREVKLLLDPFRQAINVLAKSASCTASLIQPVIAVIVDRLQALAPVIKHAASKLLHAQLSTVTAIPFSDEHSDMHFKIAVALDPKLCHRAEQVAVDYIKQQVLATNETSADSPGSGSASDRPPTPVFDIMQALAVKSPTMSKRDSEEYALFRRAEATSANSPIVYWHEHRQTFPRLASIARRVFLMQATCVPCERLFNGTDTVVSQKRSSLSAELVEPVMFLLSAYRARPA